MITKYPDDADICEVITEKMPYRNTRNFFKKRGVLFISNNNRKIADYGCRFLLGHSDYEEMRDSTDDVHNYKKASAVELQSKQEIAALKDEFARKRGEVLDPKNNLTITNVTYDNERLKCTISYVSKNSGSVSLIREEPRTCEFVIEAKDDKKLVQISHQKIEDHTKAIEVINAVSNDLDTSSKLSLKSISLETLSLTEKIELFDKLLTYKFEECELKCRLENVTGIKTKKGTKREELESQLIEIEENGIEKTEPATYEVPEADVRNISEAVLRGDNLRTNDFVKKLIKRGHHISGITIKLAHLKDPIKVSIQLTFKTKPVEFLEIKVFKSVEIIDEEEDTKILPFDEQSKYIKTITEILWEIYNSFENRAVEQTPKIKEDKKQTVKST